VPAYRNRTVFEVARGLKAFLSLDASLTRSPVPDLEQMLKQVQHRIKKKNQRIERMQTRLSNKDQHLRLLQHELNGDLKDSSRGSQQDLYGVRKNIAFRYLTGSGLEVGALHQPLEVPPDVTVRYVDIKTVDQLRELFPELSEYDLVEVDIVDDGETLSSIADASVDFVIANHMLEHSQSTIGTIENHLRVLKPDGILYLAVPDKRFTFDRDRPLTTLEHLIRDYKEGPEWSVRSDYEEWARLVEAVPEGDVATQVQSMITRQQNIHWHVWTQTEFLQLLLYCQTDLGFPFEIELIQKNSIELVSILRKKPSSS
jgi:SAM-dependent methyltransferase